MKIKQYNEIFSKLRMEFDILYNHTDYGWKQAKRPVVDFNISKLIENPLYDKIIDAASADRDLEIFSEKEKGQGNKQRHPVVLFLSFCTNGASGGNCWGDEAEYFDNNLSYSDYDHVYLNLWKNLIPDITEDECEILEKCVFEIQNSVSEYYGNYSNYSVFSVLIEELIYVLEIEDLAKRVK